MSVDDNGDMLPFIEAPAGTSAPLRALNPYYPRLAYRRVDAYYLFQVNYPSNSFALPVDATGMYLEVRSVPFTVNFPWGVQMTSPNGTEYMLTIDPTGKYLTTPRNWGYSPAANSFGQQVGQIDPLGNKYNDIPTGQNYPWQPNGQSNPVTFPDQRPGDKSGGRFSAGCGHVFPYYDLHRIASQYPPSNPPYPLGPFSTPNLYFGTALVAKCPICGYVAQVFDPAWKADFIWTSPMSERELSSPRPL